jgi:hypothetical protein
MSLRSAEAIHGSILAPWQNWIIPRCQLEVHRNGREEPERCISLPTVPHRRTICGIEVRRELYPIADAIERSRGMLDLEDDWDGEGSPAYQQEDWERAVRMLLRGCVDYLEKHAEAPATPLIYNGPEGGIDILWEHGERSLLLNVTAGAQSRATFYGRDQSGLELKGTLDPTAPELWFLLLLLWVS